MIRSLLIAYLGSLLWTLPALAADPPAPTPLTAEARTVFVQEIASLRAAAKSLQSERPDVRQLADAEIGIEAVDRSLRFEELTKKNSAAQARAILALAKQRIDTLQAGKHTWGQTPGRTVLGYRSRVDGTAQPYALTLPEGYTEKGSDRLPLYIELHGRGDQSEVPFFAQHEGKPAPAGQTYLKLDVFGRGNNAYRYAGEADVFEALADVIRRYRVDERRIVLWGFSMGGAGAWHVGLHYPAKWCSVGPGAGFVDFYSYQKVKQPLPAFQDRTLHIYDTTNYAMNLANVPLVTYGGEIDPQLAASTTMRNLAGQLNIPVNVIIGPMMGHKFDDASQAAFMAFHEENAKRGLPESSDRRKVRFTTCTVKYNECDWLRIEEQTIPYEESIVESEMEGDDTLHLDTENVNALSVSRTIADKISIDDSADFPLTEAASGRLPEVYFVKENDAWQLLDYDDSIAFAEPTEPHKRHNLQGPIDDAFSQSFVCVRGTGTPWSKSHQAYADWNLARFQKEFDQWMRGHARTFDDTAITDELIENHNLVLFGDPGSNAVLARVIENLPLDWTKDAVTFNDTSYNPDLHCVALIFPNPLNRSKYVVLNSGHSFHEKEFKASNAQLYPRLGDAAVLRFRADKKSEFSEEIVTGEILNSRWELEE